MFDEETAAALKQILGGMPRKVTDYLVVADHVYKTCLGVEAHCHSCDEAVALAKELERLSGGKLEFKIIKIDDPLAKKLGICYAPAFVYGSPGLNVRYYGLPAGEEFPPFVYVHTYIASGKLKLPERIIDAVKMIKTDLHAKIFVTPQCPYCPLTVDTLNQMGLVNPRIRVETIEAVELPWEADKYNVQYVPVVVISDVERIDGYVPPEITVKFLRNAEARLLGKEPVEKIQLAPEHTPIEDEHHHHH